jgi:hypothetical protein
MHNIVSMYLMYHVSSIIVVNLSKNCVLLFTFHGFLVTPTCVLQFLNLRSNKGGKVLAKSVEENSFAATSATV